MRRLTRRATAITAAALVVAGVTGAGPAVAASRTINIAYMSFAVANSYDAPMLAAARAVAQSSGAKLTVFDANNDPTTQYNQIQNVISTGKYQGIIVQPIYGAALIPVIKQAIAKKIKVVNIDQILGTNYESTKIQVPGLSGNVVFAPPAIATAMGNLVTQACAASGANPCKVGYLWSLKASALDVTMKKIFDSVIAKTPSIQIVAEGESYWTPTAGLSATQNMLQANPDLNVVVGADQGIEGAAQAVAGAGKTGKVALVGYGGSATGINAVKSGAWFGTVMQAPASTGELGMRALIKAIRTGKKSGVINPIASFANKGVVTKANAKKFLGEWPG